jgi:hypothetical protein
MRSKDLYIDNAARNDAFVWTWPALSKVTMTAIGSFLVVWWWLAVVLHFRFMQSDVLAYWRDSLAWQTPFNPDHVPGYPLLIALLRFLTAEQLEPIGLFLSIAFCAHIAGALAVYLSVTLRTNQHIGFLSAILFILWPLVGTTYVVYPMADSLALALIAWGVALWLSERFHGAAICLGLATVKGTWIFVIFLLLAGIITHRRRFPWTALLIAACPLGLLWVAGMNENEYGPFWLLSVSLPIQFATKSSLPFLDGLMGTILQGGMKSLTKSVILWAHVALLVTLCVALFRERDPTVKWLGLAVVGGLLFLYGGLNQHIIWAALRYSKIAAIPLGFYLGTKPRVTAAVTQHPWIIVSLVVVLLASQLAYCWYMAIVFWAQ